LIISATRSTKYHIGKVIIYKVRWWRAKGTRIPRRVKGRNT